MRWLIWFIGLGMTLAASSAWAQMFDPNYPICMELRDGDSTRYECFFTSLAQCTEASRGMPGICFNNPGYVAPRVEAEPAPEPVATPSPTSAKKKK